MAANPQAFSLANPHALSCIVEASATRRIVASQDIFDDRGTKLWARDQPVSPSLHERLLQRKLRHPLEACLRAEDGVGIMELHDALATFIASHHALAQVARPFEDRLLHEVKRLPLHAVVQLLLTTSHATKPEVFEHAVRGMALAGAMQMSVKSDPYDHRLAMLGGLLHDLGEMYVNPKYLDGSQKLDIRSYRHVATHPRVGELLLATTTDYPMALARAVGEHHERLDGTGYPMRATGGALSPLGRLLAITETALGIASAPRAPLARISFALRMIPGEYEPGWIGFLATAATQAQEDIKAVLPDADALNTRLSLMDTTLAQIDEQARILAARTDVSSVAQEVARNVSTRVERLRVGGNAIGLWSTASNNDSPESLFELTTAMGEIGYRLNCLERDCLWPHPDVSTEDAERLAPLWPIWNA
ncbi:MAG: HD domain-containing protein [Burkholderiaceae bacterium]|nr:HD domain-containing protein [Burkholderiaceae bacterium]